MNYKLSKNPENILFYRHFDAYQILYTVYANDFPHTFILR